MGHNYWEPGESGRAPICYCRCHGIALMNATTGTVTAFLNVPPRFDNPMAHAEACSRCEFSHWVAATVTDQVTQLEATENENLSIFNIHHKRT